MALFALKVGLGAVAAGMLAAAQPAGGAQVKPQRVMSLNACTDQLVLALLPLQRISSVTYLAQGAAVTPQLRAKAGQARVNHGLAEEVLAQKPDLVIGGPFTAPEARRLIASSGAPLLDVEAADNIEAIRTSTRKVAAALGEAERGEALIRAMDAQLAQLARTAPAPRILTAGWDGSGRAPGRQSLFNEMLTLAGGVNLAAGEGSFESSMDMEQLLAARPKPELLLYTLPDAGAPTLQTLSVRHPALARAFERRLAVPSYQCGTPDAPLQVLALRRAMQNAVRPEAAR